MAESADSGLANSMADSEESSRNTLIYGQFLIIQICTFKRNRPEVGRIGTFSLLSGILGCAIKDLWGLWANS